MWKETAGGIEATNPNSLPNSSMTGRLPSSNVLLEAFVLYGTRQDGQTVAIICKESQFEPLTAKKKFFFSIFRGI